MNEPPPPPQTGGFSEIPSTTLSRFSLHSQQLLDISPGNTYIAVFIVCSVRIGGRGGAEAVIIKGFESEYHAYSTFTFFPFALGKNGVCSHSYYVREGRLCIHPLLLRIDIDQILEAGLSN